MIMNYRMQHLRLALPLLVITLAYAAQLRAQVPLPDAKPVPRMQVIPEPYDQASVLRDGQEITRYHFGTSLNRPFLYPLIGPSGRSLTRMGHPRDPNSHSHHNSVWISHHDVNGVDFWGDRGKGRIVHKRIMRYEDSDGEARIEVQNAWTDDTGKVLLDELRRMLVLPLDNGQWLLVIDLQIAAPREPATLGKTPFGLIGVRMAKTIGVHDGGGMSRNSAGEVNEQGVFWKPAKWLDYSGPITPDAAEGITLMDHPSNPNHPTHFHVRDDGWMGASLTFDTPRTIEPGQPLTLRYGLLVHAGVPSVEQLERQYQQFVKLPVEPLGQTK
jgi:hypothetical protein